MTRSGPLNPTAPTLTRQAHAGALTAYHPSPLILEETLPDYQTTLDSLPEEPDPVTLPVLKGSFFQLEDMDAESVADPPVNPSTNEATSYTVPMHATKDTPLSEPSLGPMILTAEETRHAALTAFLTPPRLRDPTRIKLGDISLLLYLLLDTPGRLVALSRITLPIPSAEATGIWEA